MYKAKLKADEPLEIINEHTAAAIMDKHNRYFSSLKNKRLQTAWSLAGAELFLTNNERFQKAFKAMEDRGRGPFIVYVRQYSPATT